MGNEERNFPWMPSLNAALKLGSYRTGIRLSWYSTCMVLRKLRLVGHTCDPRSREAEAEGPYSVVIKAIHLGSRKIK